MVTLGVELYKRLGRLAVHLVADARSPDRLAVGVELEVAVGRLAVVGAHDVYLGLRFGPKPLAGRAVDQDKVPLVCGPWEFARDQHVLAVEGYVKHLGISAAKLWCDVLELVRLGVEDRHVGYVAQECATTLLDPREATANPDVGADLLDSPDAPIDHWRIVGLLRGQRQDSPAGKKKSYRRKQQHQKGLSHPYLLL